MKNLIWFSAACSKLLGHLEGGAVRLLVAAIMGYQKIISPDHGFLRRQSPWSRCKFYPSCSSYALLSLRQYGLLYGGVASLRRIFRCNPFNRGGYDPVRPCS